MKTTKILTIHRLRSGWRAVLILAVGVMVCAAEVSEAVDMGTGFTYQGRLIDANSVADGPYDFQFKLFDDPNIIIGNQIGSDTNIPDVDVIDGYFTVLLDFNEPNAFNGDARWLEIGVRDYDPCDVNAFTTLSPRQEVMPTPYAIYSGSDGDWMVSGNDMYSIPSGNVGIGTTSPLQKLHVVGNVIVQGASPLWMELISNFGTDAGINLTTFGPGVNTWEIIRDGDSTNFLIRETMPYEPFSIDALTIKADGNVGIGITNPQEKLDVHGPINTDSAYKIATDTVLSTPVGFNTFVGIRAGANNASHHNTFLGYEAGYSNTEGSDNTFVGERAGYSNTEGHCNTFVGEVAGGSNTEGTANTFVGNYAGCTNTEGYSNTFLGYYAGRSNTTGAHNTFLGFCAGSFNAIGPFNTFLGNRAGQSNTTGAANTFLGSQAGYSNTTGAHNTFLGNGAGYSNQTGTGNVFIGYQAGGNETGSNKLYIANGPNDANTLIYGDFSAGNVGIGTMSPGSARLKISGGVLDMSSQKITNVADPTASQDAATKKYVDDNVGIPSLKTYDSGWFAISPRTLYGPFVHNLGTTKLLCSIYGAMSVTGTDMGMTKLYAGDDLVLGKITSTECYLYVRGDIAHIWRGMGDDWQKPTHARIIMLALE